MLSWRAFGEGVSTTPDTTVDLTPLGLLAGDTVFLCASEGGSGAAGFSTLTGWTRLFNRIDATMGDWALYVKTWSVADSLSETLVPAVGLHTCYVCVGLHSSDAGTVVYGSPPALGYDSGQERTNSPASTTLTFETVAEDESGDLWIAFYKTDNSTTITVPYPWFELKRQNMSSNTLGVAITNSKWHGLTPSVTWTIGASVISGSMAMAVADSFGENLIVSREIKREVGLWDLPGFSAPDPNSGRGQGGGIGIFVGG